ncbi:MAG: DUF3144 domain-containing protein [Halioglobus sp.]
MADSENEIHQAVMQKFIDLANTIKDDGTPPRVISAGLMTASCVYSTYTVAGNGGGLNESGVEKVTDAYRRQLQMIQDARRSEVADKETGAEDT